jgi:hypothetical protein
MNRANPFLSNRNSGTHTQAEAKNCLYPINPKGASLAYVDYALYTDVPELNPPQILHCARSSVHRRTRSC